MAHKVTTQKAQISPFSMQEVDRTPMVDISTQNAMPQTVMVHTAHHPIINLNRKIQFIHHCNSVFGRLEFSYCSV
jgi:predicted transcriptional regulator